MVKTFKEYIGVSRGYAIGPISISKPMASMGGSQFYPQHRRYSTVYASYSGAGHGTFKPMTSLNASKQLPPHLSKFFDKDGNVKDKNVQKKIEKFPIKTALQNMKDQNHPHWLVFDMETKKGIVQDLPTREDITIPIQEQLIVELYSR